MVASTPSSPLKSRPRYYGGSAVPAKVVGRLKQGSGDRLQVVHVLGDAGSGRTRFIQELYEELVATQAQPFWDHGLAPLPPRLREDGSAPRSERHDRLNQLVPHANVEAVPPFYWVAVGCADVHEDAELYQLLSSVVQQLEPAAKECQRRLTTQQARAERNKAMVRHSARVIADFVPGGGTLFDLVHTASELAEGTGNGRDLVSLYRKEKRARADGRATDEVLRDDLIVRIGSMLRGVQEVSTQEGGEPPLMVLVLDDADQASTELFDAVTQLVELLRWDGVPTAVVLVGRLGQRGFDRWTQQWCTDELPSQVHDVVIGRRSAGPEDALTVPGLNREAAIEYLSEWLEDLEPEATIIDAMAALADASADWRRGIEAALLQQYTQRYRTVVERTGAAPPADWVQSLPTHHVHHGIEQLHHLGRVDPAALRCLGIAVAVGGRAPMPLLTSIDPELEVAAQRLVGDHRLAELEPQFGGRTLRVPEERTRLAVQEMVADEGFGVVGLTPNAVSATLEAWTADHLADDLERQDWLSHTLWDQITLSELAGAITSLRRITGAGGLDPAVALFAEAATALMANGRQACDQYETEELFSGARDCLAAPTPASITAASLAVQALLVVPGGERLACLLLDDLVDTAQRQEGYLQAPLTAAAMLLTLPRASLHRAQRQRIRQALREGAANVAAMSLRVVTASDDEVEQAWQDLRAAHSSGFSLWLCEHLEKRATRPEDRDALRGWIRPVARANSFSATVFASLVPDRSHPDTTVALEFLRPHVHPRRANTYALVQQFRLSTGDARAWALRRLISATTGTAGTSGLARVGIAGSAYAASAEERQAFWHALWEHRHTVQAGPVALALVDLAQTPRERRMLVPLLSAAAEHDWQVVPALIDLDRDAGLEAVRVCALTSEEGVGQLRRILTGLAMGTAGAAVGVAALATTGAERVEALELLKPHAGADGDAAAAYAGILAEAPPSTASVRTAFDALREHVRAGHARCAAAALLLLRDHERALSEVDRSRDRLAAIGGLAAASRTDVQAALWLLEFGSEDRAFGNWTRAASFVGLRPDQLETLLRFAPGDREHRRALGRLRRLVADGVPGATAAFATWSSPAAGDHELYALLSEQAGKSPAAASIALTMADDADRKKAARHCLYRHMRTSRVAARALLSEGAVEEFVLDETRELAVSHDDIRARWISCAAPLGGRRLSEARDLGRRGGLETGLALAQFARGGQDRQDLVRHILEHAVGGDLDAPVRGGSLTLADADALEHLWRREPLAALGLPFASRPDRRSRHTAWMRFWHACESDVDLALAVAEVPLAVLESALPYGPVMDQERAGSRWRGDWRRYVGSREQRFEPSAFNLELRRWICLMIHASSNGTAAVAAYRAARSKQRRELALPQVRKHLRGSIWVTLSFANLAGSEEVPGIALAAIEHHTAVPAIASTAALAARQLLDPRADVTSELRRRAPESLESVVALTLARELADTRLARVAPDDVHDWRSYQQALLPRLDEPAVAILAQRAGVLGALPALASAMGTNRDCAIAYATGASTPTQRHRARDALRAHIEHDVDAAIAFARLATSAGDVDDGLSALLRHGDGPLEVLTRLCRTAEHRQKVLPALLSRAGSDELAATELLAWEARGHAPSGIGLPLTASLGRTNFDVAIARARMQCPEDGGEELLRLAETTEHLGRLLDAMGDDLATTCALDILARGVRGRGSANLAWMLDRRGVTVQALEALAPVAEWDYTAARTLMALGAEAGSQRDLGARLLIEHAQSQPPAALRLVQFSKTSQEQMDALHAIAKLPQPAGAHAAGLPHMRDKLEALLFDELHRAEKSHEWDRYERYAIALAVLADDVTARSRARRSLDVVRHRRGRSDGPAWLVATLVTSEGPREFRRARQQFEAVEDAHREAVMTLVRSCARTSPSAARVVAGECRGEAALAVLAPHAGTDIGALKDALRVIRDAGAPSVASAQIVARASELLPVGDFGLCEVATIVLTIHPEIGRPLLDGLEAVERDSLRPKLVARLDKAIERTRAVSAERVRTRGPRPAARSGRRRDDDGRGRQRGRHRAAR